MHRVISTWSIPILSLWTSAKMYEWQWLKCLCSDWTVKVGISLLANGRGLRLSQRLNQDSRLATLSIGPAILWLSASALFLSTIHCCHLQFHWLTAFPLLTGNSTGHPPLFLAYIVYVYIYELIPDLWLLRSNCVLLGGKCV